MTSPDSSQRPPGKPTPGGCGGCGGGGALGGRTPESPATPVTPKPENGGGGRGWSLTIRTVAGPACGGREEVEEREVEGEREG